MIKKIIELFKYKEISSLSITQSFGYYMIEPESYQVVFLENIFSRRVRIGGSKWLTSCSIWKGTEVYVLTIRPWLTQTISNDDLINHLKTFRLRSDYGTGKIPAKKKPATDNNVIAISKYLSNRSTENQSEV